MKNRLTFLGMLLAAAGPAATSHGAIINLSPVADAFVTAGSANPSAGLPHANYGGAGALMISGAGTAKGEMQSLLKFDLSAAKGTLDGLFGPGLWHVNSITLLLGTNFGTGGVQPNNPIFNTVAGGAFKVDWLANDNWGEGTGNPGAAFFPPNPPVDGVTFDTLSLLMSGEDETLGTFTYTAVGNTNPPTIPAATYALGLSTDFLADVLAGSNVSLRAYPGDNSVGYLFNARSFGTAANRPVLVINADAVPEPGTTFLLAGAACAGLLRRRRHANAQ